MNDDPFENQLRAQPPRLPSAAWRGEILAAAALALAPSPRRSVIAEWLWPRPMAYAALLAVWAVILTLKLDTPASSRASASGSSTAGQVDASDQAALIAYASRPRGDALFSRVANLEEVRP